MASELTLPVIEFVNPSLGVFSISSPTSQSANSASAQQVWFTLLLNQYESLNYRYWLDLRWNSDSLRHAVMRLHKGQLLIAKPIACVGQGDGFGNGLDAQLHDWADHLVSLKTAYLQSRR